MFLKLLVFLRSVRDSAPFGQTDWGREWYAYVAQIG